MTNRVFPIILAVGLGIAVLIGVSFALNRSPEPQPTPGPSPSPVPDDWLTYRNEEFGFEVKYPSDLTLLQEGGVSAFVSFGKPEHSSIGESSLDIKILKGITEKEALGEAHIWTRDEIIQLQRNEPKQFPPDFNAEEFTKTQEYWLFDPVNSYPTPVQEILVNGKKALVGEFDVRLGDTEGGYVGLGASSMTLLFGDNNTYSLIYTGFNADSVVLRQILSTFRLIE